MKYKLLGKSGLRVSEICLGTMSFGTEWGWGADIEMSRKVFETFASAGGNFIDTANRYTEGTSEKFIGEFIKADRHRYVIASKYTLFDRKGDPNFSGNHSKNLRRSVDETLRRLNIEYLDILYVHAWDGTVEVERLMRSLNDLVSAGKVLHLGISDAPAWVVSQANTIASIRGWAPFEVLQVEYSLMQRTPDRDLLPMADAFGMSLATWAPLAGGALTGKYLRNDPGRLQPSSQRLNDKNTLITEKVVDIAQRLGVTPSQIALNFVRQKNSNIIPIVGARKVEQISDSLGCINFTIPESNMQELLEISQIDLGFPHDFLSSEGVLDVMFGGTYSQIIVR